MLHLLKYSFLSKIRNFNIVFWPLVFPLVLGTFFTLHSEISMKQIFRRFRWQW
ncbi:MAG: hypothetical protein ACLUI0_07910 [Blautia massiliensis (ex Durand et al. 2017)]